MGCGLKATKDNFSCSSLNVFKEIRVISRTIIKNNITIINDGQNMHDRVQEVNTWEESF